MSQAELFTSIAPQLPEGFRYQRAFLADAEEQALLRELRALPFESAQYREWHARRRIVSYGGRYDFPHHVLNEAPPLPSFLIPLRARVAQLAQVPAEDFVQALVAEYAPQTPLG